MTRSAVFSLASLVLMLIVTAGCGGGSMMTSSPMVNGPRQLQGLTVTPSSADAQKFPNGQVQFTATGTFNMAPISVMSPLVRWSVGNPFATPLSTGMTTATMSPAPTISAGGLAQCNGFMGIATIEATAPADSGMPISQMNTMTRNVTGMAQLICP